MAKSADTLDDATRWKAMLHGAGLRITPPRLAVLERLEASATPQSHGDLVASLKKAKLDRVTIYRNLNDLTDAGLVEKRDLGDHTWRFELKRERPASSSSAAGKSGTPHAVPTEHPHFTCTDCGTVECLPDIAVSVPKSKGLPRSVTEKRVLVTLQGLCNDCDD